MEKKEFTITINAPRKKVWETLWSDETYREWTSAFAEGSQAETDWKKGSKVVFSDGKGDGMVACIEESVPNEYMGIKHLGVIKGGVEDLESEEVKSWAGARENYTLKDANGGTMLTVDMDINEEYMKYFLETWPKALQKIKDVAERN